MSSVSSYSSAVAVASAADGGALATDHRGKRGSSLRRTKGLLAIPDCIAVKMGGGGHGAENRRLSGLAMTTPTC